MKAPLIARILGIAFLIATMSAAVPFAVTGAGPGDEYIQLTSGYGFLAGIFPVNGAHDLLHGIFAVWGIAASFSFASSVRYCRWVTWTYALLTILGAIPITNTLFGAVPIYGYDIWLHAAIALFAAYGAYGAARLETPLEEPLLPPPGLS
jgi:hypothetical protein